MDEPGLSITGKQIKKIVIEHLQEKHGYDAHHLSFVSGIDVYTIHYNEHAKLPAQQTHAHDTFSVLNIPVDGMKQYLTPAYQPTQVDYEDVAYEDAVE